MLLTVLCMPESPRFHAMHGRYDLAKGVLLKFKSIDRETENDLKTWNETSSKKRVLGIFKDAFSVKYALPLFGLFAFEQLIGAISILFYLQKILTLTGKWRLNGVAREEANGNLIVSEGEYSPEVTAVLCTSIFVCSVILPNIVDYEIPIKRYLMWSTNLMAVSLLALGVYCHYQGSFGHEYTEDHKYLPLLCLGVFFFFFATGPYRLTHEYAENIIPKKDYFTVRCMLSVISWGLIYGITRILSSLIDFIGVGWLFWYMAFMCIFMSIFVRIFMPEIKRNADECKLVDSTSGSFSEV